MKFLAKVFSFIKEIWVEILIVIVCFGISIPFLLFSKPVLVGDGREYYALSIAWSSTHKPYMTDASWQKYSLLENSGEIAGLNNAPRLKDLFPALRLGSSADFNHFWFYSFLAAVISEIGDIVGIRIPINSTFLLLHFTLLACMLLIAWRCFGWRGLIAAIILTLCSPIIWYIDKVHTEFFTYCVTTSAVIFFLKRRYIPSAFFLALAATQNISFGAISFFVLAVELVVRKGEKYSSRQVIMVILTILLLVLQPAYYYSRLGVLNTQVIAGGASVGSNLRYAYVWFFDPDLGLLPNWPIGVILLVSSIINLDRKKLTQQSFYFWISFVACFVFISLMAQSSTTNLNSGATPGIARYSLWYIALFFPSIFLIVKRIDNSPWLYVLSIGLLVIGFFWNFKSYRPSVDGGGNGRPSPTSVFIQTYLPKLYNPPPEVFAERYGGLGETVALYRSLAVIGPDCHKVLLIDTTPNNGDVVLGLKSCGFDYEKIVQTIRGHLTDGTWLNNAALSYAELSFSDVTENRFITKWNEWYSITSDYNFDTSIFKGTGGWSFQENWGTWTDGKKATLTIRCPSNKANINGLEMIELELQPFISTEHPQVNLSIKVDSNAAWSGSVFKDEIIQLSLPDKACRTNSIMKIQLLIDNPISLYALGYSSDKRMLGIGLKRIRFIE